VAIVARAHIATHGAQRRYASGMEWTPARIRLLREAGLCQSQPDFAKTVGFAPRTIGNAERATHPPSLALRRALDQALERASDAQRDRFLAAVAAHDAARAPGTRSSSADLPGQPVHILGGLRSAVLGTPPAVQPDADRPLKYRSAGSDMAITVRVHHLYQMADYDGATQLLLTALTCLQNPAGTGSGHDECLVGTLTTRHATAAVYIAAAKLATKLGDVVLASVTADRAMTAAKESGHPALVGAATYQVAGALLLTGELAAAEQILTVGAEKIASVVAAPRLNCLREEALSVAGSLLLLLAITVARRGDPNAAQKALRDAGHLAEQLGADGNWLWTAFGPTNVAIHQLSAQRELNNTKLAMQLGETIDTESLPAALRGRRSRVHLELGWAAAGQGDDTLAVLHLLETERIAEQAVSRHVSARRLLGMLLARERRSATPGLRGLASRAGLIP